MTIRLEVFEDADWADQVVERWSAWMQRCPKPRLCLPTGETPAPVYAKAVSHIDFHDATVFMLDEFDLPRGHPARCDEMFRRDFLDRLSESPGAVHALDPAAPDPGAECRRFAALVDKAGLDLTLLGLGGNGHLGLNEPGSSADAPTRVVRLAPSTIAAAGRYGPDAKPERGMTLGMRAILDSKEIWLLVTGSHKTGILNRVLSDPIGLNLPASYLREHSNVTVFADRSATGRLR